MKPIITILTLVSVSLSYAQNINMSSFNEGQNNFSYVNFGYDFGVTTQIGYGYKINTVRPIFINADYSMPMGEDLADDFKIRLGGQISIYEIQHFIFSAKVYAIFRRHQTKLVRMASFGSEMSAIVGYYKLRWYLAGEFGFDKSINTHLKHSDIMKENFPAITDGWYVPSGGHFFYGIAGSKTMGNHFEITFRAGVTNAQFEDENALLPYYAQLGLNYRFSSKKRNTNDYHEL